MKQQLVILTYTIGICIAATLAKSAGVDQATIDTLAMVSALAMSIVLMVKVGRRIR